MRFVLRLVVASGAVLLARGGAFADEPPRETTAVLAPHMRTDVPTLHTGDGRVLFVGVEPASGAEPWITDGTPVGTRMLFDLHPGALDSQPRFTRVVGGRALIVAEDDATGEQRTWSVALDGSSAEMLADGPVNAAALVGDRAVFEREGLWVTDGSAAATTRLADVPSLRSAIHSLGDRAVFFADDGVEDTAGTDDLYATDGTPAGTLKIANVGRLAYGTGRFTAVVRGDVWFTGPMGMWTTDGTAEGTGYARAIMIDPMSGYPEPWPHSADGVVAWTHRDHYGGLMTGSIDFGIPRFRAPWGRGPASAGTVLGASGSTVFVSAVAGRWPRGLRGELRVCDSAGGSRVLRLPRTLGTSGPVHAVGDTGTAVWLTEQRGRAGPRLVVSDGRRKGTRVVTRLDRQRKKGAPGPRILAVLGTRVLCAVDAADDDGFALVAIDVAGAVK